MTVKKSISYNLSDLLTKIKVNGGRVTQAKKLILEIFLSNPEHVTADEIFDNLVLVLPKLNISTVYRILEELENNQIITHTHFGHGPASFELNCDLHSHIICQICNTTQYLPFSIFENLANIINKKYSFSLDLSHFAIVGTCKNCMQLQSNQLQNK
jgi:Fur family ferric uptake transcriptional regulator